MDYMKLIVEMLDKASVLQLERLYHFIKAFLGDGFSASFFLLIANSGGTIFCLVVGKAFIF